MKKLNVITLAISLLALSVVLYSFKPGEKNYEFTSITIVESIVPSGAGRSRIINA